MLQNKCSHQLMFYDFEFAQILRRVIHFDALPGVVYLSFADKCQLCMIQFCYSLHNGPD